jgi:arginyl-tRNA synthetase
MDTILVTFQREVTFAIEKAFGPGYGGADIAPCLEEQFGHYQCNSALRLSKLVKENPRVVAQKIIDALQFEMCSKIEIAGPGFINFTLSSKFLSLELQKQLNDPLLGATPPAQKEKVVVEFSSPNIAKELHVGHIRSTIIGDCLARVFEFLGYNVLRLNHLGDWGTQFGMLITYMHDFCPKVLKGEEATDLASLMQWYKAAKKRFDEDAEFKLRSQKEVVRLQSGDSKALHAWKLICDVSRIGFQEIYDLMDIKIVERGESFYNPMLGDIVHQLTQKGLITLSEGAKCLYLDGFQIPLIVQKSDGGYNYDTTDLAAIYHRVIDEKAHRLIYVVDMGQSLHFQMIFAAAKKAGWLDKARAEHVAFGLVLGADGKKFKTRSGDTEKLIDLLVEAIDKARAIITERLPHMSEKEVEHLARVLGVGAVKYADLSSLRTKDYMFSYDKMLRFEGNTAVFLLYAYVRINGIKRKTHANMDQTLAHHKIQLHHPSEVSLGLHLRRFGEVIEMVERDLLPNRLTDYLYELAEKFNGFFRDCRVEGSAEEGSRLVLCELTARVLKQGLELLGLQTVERM